MNKDRYNNELWVLGGIAAGIIALLILVAIFKAEWDVAACLIVLQLIISTIDNRNKARTTDRMANQLAASPPPADGKPQDVRVVNEGTDPVPTEDKP